MQKQSRKAQNCPQLPKIAQKRVSAFNTGFDTVNLHRPTSIGQNPFTGNSD